MITAKDRLIVALDVPSVADAKALVTKLGDAVTFYKIGYQLGYASGFPFAEELIQSGKKVFLDLKLHDIGNTVARGVESVAKLGATFLTIHAYPQTMKAAVEARAGSRSEEHTSELQSQFHLVCRLLLEKKKEAYYAELQQKLQSFETLNTNSYERCNLF